MSYFFDSTDESAKKYRHIKILHLESGFQYKRFDMKILITGSRGLIGKALTNALTEMGIDVVSFDQKNTQKQGKNQNVLDKKQLEKAAHQCHGIIHLAAISRVLWGEKDPDLCWKTNYDGTLNVLNTACTSPHKPWVIFSSSREVYGDPDSFPVLETAPLKPVNIYGRSKAAAEALVLSARTVGINTAVVRYSNVYGAVDDHPDRVIPAFCKAAAKGEPLRVDGLSNTFDFVHLDDTVRGTLKIAERLMEGVQNLPPFHLTTGKATSLKTAADLANTAGGNLSSIIEAPSRTFDVAHFFGDARQTRDILDWSPLVPIEQGIQTLTHLFQRQSYSSDETLRPQGDAYGYS